MADAIGLDGNRTIDTIRTVGSRACERAAGHGARNGIQQLVIHATPPMPLRRHSKSILRLSPKVGKLSCHRAIPAPAFRPATSAWITLTLRQAEIQRLFVP
jgi:hypothetical protein